MLMRSLLEGRTLFRNFTHQVRTFSQKVVPNQVYQYFCRAKLIDSIRLSLRSGSPDSLFRILENPGLDSFVVANALRSAPSPEIALSFVEALKRVPNFCHTQHTLHAIAKILARSGRTAQLKKLVDAINAGKFRKVPPVSYIDRMRWYAAAGDIDLVLGVWDELRAQGKRPCVESYNIVMELYVQKGKDLEAVHTFRSMMQGGVIPNSRTFTIVIEHLVNSGKVERAKEIFDILPRMRVKRTLRQYSLLLEALVNLEQFDDVKSLLREMRSEGVLPPRSMLSSLQRVREAGLSEIVDEIVQEMPPDDRIEKIELSDDLNNDENEEDVEGRSSDADASAVQLKPWLDPSALASALRNWTADDVSVLDDAKIVWTSRLVCKMIRHFKSPQTALQFFSWVAHQRGFMHDIHTYSGLITKLSSHGKVVSVNDVLLKVKSEGIKLAFSTVRQIIDFYGLLREEDAALRVFRDVTVLCDPLSEFDMVNLYSSLFRNLLKCGRDCDTINMVEQMFSLGLHPDAQTFTGLMHHFAVKGDFRMVQKLFEMVRQSGLEPDSYMYKTLIRAYCKCGRATIALRLFEDMRNSDLIPDGATKSLLVKSLWKEGRLREASIVEGNCKEIGDNIPLPSPSQLFNISSTDLELVHKLYCGSFQGTSGLLDRALAMIYVFFCISLQLVSGEMLSFYAQYLPGFPG